MTLKVGSVRVRYLGSKGDQRGGDSAVVEEEVHWIHPADSGVETRCTGKVEEELEPGPSERIADSRALVGFYDGAADREEEGA
jgi:hypothetical protein